MVEIERNIQEDAKINRFKLEEESESMSRIFLYYDDLLSKQKSILDSLQSEEKKVRAEVFARLSNTLSDGKKPSAQYVSSIIDADKEVSEIENKINKEKKKKYLLETAVNTLDLKRKNLDNLVQLYIKDYYSGKTSTNRDQNIEAQLKKEFNNKYKEKE